MSRSTIRSLSSARSRMSPSTRDTGPCSVAHVRLLRLPRTRLSSTTTSAAPLRTSWSTMWEPTVPAPPVTTARAPLIATAALIGHLAAERPRRGIEAGVTTPRAGRGPAGPPGRRTWPRPSRIDVVNSAITSSSASRRAGPGRSCRRNGKRSWPRAALRASRQPCRGRHRGRRRKRAVRIEVVPTSPLGAADDGRANLGRAEPVDMRACDGAANSCTVTRRCTPRRPRWDRRRGRRRLQARHRPAARGRGSTVGAAPSPRAHRRRAGRDRGRCAPSRRTAGRQGRRTGWSRGRGPPRVCSNRRGRHQHDPLLLRRTDQPLTLDVEAASGFSTSTCLPAAMAASTTSACVRAGVATATASTSGSASTSDSLLVTRTVLYGPTTRAARCSSRSAYPEEPCVRRRGVADRVGSPVAGADHGDADRIDAHVACSPNVGLRHPVARASPVISGVRPNSVAQSWLPLASISDGA